MIATRPNLIVVPVGLTIDHFIKLHNVEMKRNDHWRFKYNDRCYDILAVQYGNFEPEEDTYDFLVKATGNKWKIVKTLHNDKIIDFSQWEQIALFDDDVVVSCDSVDAAFNFSKENNLEAYQISVTQDSETSYSILKNNPEWLWTETNFMEIMCPFFSNKMFFKVMDLLNMYDVNHGWGLDYIFKDYLSTTIGVLHFTSMYHPSRPDTGSSYVKDEAKNEMNLLINQIYNRVNPNWSFTQNLILKTHLI